VVVPNRPRKRVTHHRRRGNPFPPIDLVPLLEIVSLLVVIIVQILLRVVAAAIRLQGWMTIVTVSIVERKNVSLIAKTKVTTRHKTVSWATFIIVYSYVLICRLVDSGILPSTDTLSGEEVLTVPGSSEQ